MDELERLVEAVTSVSPTPADHWEITAVIESLGYTDSRVKEEFGYENASLLGRYVYERLLAEPQPETPLATVETCLPACATADVARRHGLEEVRVFFEKFLSTFVYALSWIVIVFIEVSKSQSLLPAELASPLSLAVMFSLVAMGGFVQVIARRGLFYISLGEPALARRVSLLLLRLGLIVAILLATSGLLIGFYLDLFDDTYLVLASCYFLFLSLLWMLCAVVSIQPERWRIPAIFLTGGAVYAVASLFDSVWAQGLAIGSTYTLAIIFAVCGFGSGSPESREALLPELWALVPLLLPYFIYGSLYFAFLFADRLTAGTALPSASSLSFGVDPDYKKAMDSALLALLTTISTVEYLNHRFISRLRTAASRTRLSDVTKLSTELQKTHLNYSLITVLIFLLLSTLCYLLLKGRMGLEGRVLRVWLAGSLGYMMLSLALLNAMILFSIGRPAVVCRCLVPALIINFFTGYLLSHVISVEYATVGVFAGSLFFLITTHICLMRSLKEAGYSCFTA